jgi:hypothetical protein
MAAVFMKKDFLHHKEVPDAVEAGQMSRQCV